MEPKESIAGALLEYVRERPWSILVVLAATALGALLGAIAYYQGWLG